MKKLFYHIFIISILFFIIDFSLGIYFSKLYEKNFCQHAGGDLNHYLKFGDSDTIIIGSSRVNTMINNKKINKNCVNISKPSKHFFYNNAVIKLLKQYNKLPKNIIVLNIELEDFLIENEKKLKEDVYYLKYYYHKNTYIKKKINSLSVFEPLKFLSNCYLFNGENFKLLTNKFQNICNKDLNGYYPLNYTISKNQFYSEQKKISSKFYTEINTEVINDLIVLKKLCDYKKIRLCLLFGPILNNTFSVQKNKLENKIIAFTKKHKIEVFNFMKIKLFDNFSLWADLYHLNKKGSEIYTNLIIKKIGN